MYIDDDLENRVSDASRHVVDSEIQHLLEVGQNTEPQTAYKYSTTILQEKDKEWKLLAKALLEVGFTLISEGNFDWRRGSRAPSRNLNPWRLSLTTLICVLDKR